MSLLTQLLTPVVGNQSVTTVRNFTAEHYRLASGLYIDRSVEEGRGSQRDVVYLGWPIAPSHMRGVGSCGGLSQWVQLCTEAQLNFERSNSIFYGWRGGGGGEGSTVSSFDKDWQTGVLTIFVLYPVWKASHHARRKNRFTPLNNMMRGRIHTEK